MRLDAAALEDPVVRALVEPEARLEPGRVAIERVRVLHDELAHAKQTPARPRLVSLLGLEVVPVLRELPVAPDLARVERERLLVRHRQDELAAQAVVHVDEHRNRRAAGRGPELDRGEDRREPFLRPDRVELLTDDLLDPAVHAPAERGEAPDPGGELADEASADEELVGDRLGIGGILAQGRQEEL